MNDWTNEYTYIHQRKKPTLNPEQIDFFLQAMEDTDKITGFYINSLIQQSYDAGNNNFILSTKDDGINHLCAHLKGTQEKPILIAIEGNAMSDYGINSRYCNSTINGNAGEYCGGWSRNCQYTTNGSVGVRYGYLAVFVFTKQQTKTRINK